MRVRVFAQQPPQGRCLILSEVLNQRTTLQPAECVALAERLFAFAHTPANPALVELTEQTPPEEFVAALSGFGISVEQDPAVEQVKLRQAIG